MGAELKRLLGKLRKNFSLLSEFLKQVFYDINALQAGRYHRYPVNFTNAAPDIKQTPTRHLPDNYQKPTRNQPDTLQTLLTYMP